MRSIAVTALAFAAALAGATHSHVEAQELEPGPTRIAAVDATIASLRAHDVPAIVAAAGFVERACVKYVSPDAPLCPQGAPKGSKVGSVAFASCDGGRYFWGPGEAGVGYLFAQQLAGASTGSVFAVLRGSLTPESAEDFIVALTRGSPASPTEDGSLWQIRPDGSVVALAEPCAPIGITQNIDRYFPDPEFEVEPIYDCDPPPGDVVRAIVTVEGVYGDVFPHFWGHGTTSEGKPLMERFVVSVLNTTWTGDVAEFYLVRVGMEVSVAGVRRPNCLVRAISASVTRSAPPGAPTELFLNFLTREISWVDNANSEQGFHVRYEIAGGPTGTFTVPPNSTRFIVPSEHPIGGCGLTTIEVVAFNSAGESDPVIYSVIADCLQPDADDSDLISPPNTGAGDGAVSPARPRWHLLLALALLTGATALALGVRARHA